MLGAPFVGICEEFHPGGDSVLCMAPAGGHPGTLPGQEAPLGMGHHGQVTAVLGTHRCHSVFTAIWVEGVSLCHLTLVINVTHWDRCQ